jgi:hypothetical protein
MPDGITKSLLFIVILININFSLDSIINVNTLLIEFNNNSWSFLQLYEDCFNGIDDDGDLLVDRQDLFDC